jgi:hypothetical protein
MEILLPKKLIEEIRSIKEEADPKIYGYVCRLIIDLDDVGLLNDQICVCLGADDNGDVEVEWPSYSLFLDIERSLMPWPELKETLFRLQHPPTKTMARLSNYDGVKTLLISLLEGVLNKKDEHDEYRKDRRTQENSIYLKKDLPF